MSNEAFDKLCTILLIVAVTAAVCLSIQWLLLGGA